MWLRPLPGVFRGLFGSLTFRLALIYMVLFATSVGVLLTFIYWSTAGYMAREADATIQAEITGLAEQYRSRGLEGLSAVMHERVARNPGGSSIYLFATPDLRALAGNLSRWPDVVPDAAGWVSFPLESSAGSAEAQTRWARARVFVLRGGLHLLVGRDVHALEETRELVIRALLWGLALTIALALAGGIAMSRSTARRIEAINQTSRQIMQGALSQRIATRGSGDDFDQLAENLNAMLDRIQDLMSGVREVSDNIAHDLKTPLTRLRNHLERLQGSAAQHGAAGLHEEAEDALAEADRLLSMFNALLRIARIESGERRVAIRQCDLAALLRDITELYEPLAAESEQCLVLEPATPLVVDGDPDLLFQAFANVVENAIKYGASGGRISMRLERVGPGPHPPDSAGSASGPGSARDERATVIISDRGPGIPPQDHERVFRRFYRGEQARSTPGNGLGLSLVRAVMQLHGGSVRLESNDPGLRVVLVVPSRAGHASDAVAC